MSKEAILHRIKCKESSIGATDQLFCTLSQQKSGDMNVIFFFFFFLSLNWSPHLFFPFVTKYDTIAYSTFFSYFSERKR